MSKRKYLAVAGLVLIITTVTMQLSTRIILNAKECPQYVQDSPQNPRCDQQKYEGQEDFKEVINLVSIVLGVTALAASILMLTQPKSTK